MEKRERAIQLGKQITEARERLAALERELDALLGGAEAVETISPGLTAGSIAGRIVSALQRTGRSMTTQEIMDIASGSERGSVLAALSRLASDNQIERVSRGVYRAVKRGEP